jgi:hypothetical protein
MPVQMDNLIRMLRQVRNNGHVELWLSDLFNFNKELYGQHLPHRGGIDYPLALRQLHARDSRYVEILEAREHKYQDFSNDDFTEDIFVPSWPGHFISRSSLMQDRGEEGGSQAFRRKRSGPTNESPVDRSIGAFLIPAPLVAHHRDFRSQ